MKVAEVREEENGVYGAGFLRRFKISGSAMEFSVPSAPSVPTASFVEWFAGIEKQRGEVVMTDQVLPEILEPLRPYIKHPSMRLAGFSGPFAVGGNTGNGLHFVITVGDSGQVEVSLSQHIGPTVLPSTVDQAAKFFELWGVRPFDPIGMATRHVRHYVVVAGANR